MSWYWQKDLRKKGDTDDAWESYTPEENAKIEKAYQKKQKTLKLSAKYKIDFNDMIQFRIEERDRQRAIKREEPKEEEEEEEEDAKPAKKAKTEKPAAKKAPAKKAAKKGKAPPPPKPPKKVKLTKQGFNEMFKKFKSKPRDSDDFYIKSGKVVCGNENDIFEIQENAPDAPECGGTVFVQPLRNENGYSVRKGKWKFFEGRFLQACYHESVDESLLTEEYLKDLSQHVLDDFPNFMKGCEPVKDFRLVRKIGRYDWLMNGDANKECIFFHFVDKEQAQKLVRGHRILGEEFWDEAFGNSLVELTQVWDDPEGGGVCWYPEQEYRYGYLCTNKDDTNGDEPTLFVIYGYEAV